MNVKQKILNKNKLYGIKTKKTLSTIKKTKSSRELLLSNKENIPRRQITQEKIQKKIEEAVKIIPQESTNLKKIIFDSINPLNQDLTKSYIIKMENSMITLKQLGFKFSLEE